MRQTSLAAAAFGTIPLAGFRELEKSTNNRTKDDSVVRLLFNENPYGPSKNVLDRIDQVKARSHRYATFYEYDFLKLKSLIASQEGVEPENIALGHGSIQPLIWTAILYGGQGKEMLVPEPAFDVVGTYARKMGTTVKPVRVDANYRINLKAIEAQVTSSTDLVVLINPLNPTATSVPTEDLKAFCNNVSKTCPVCIDEAYVHYLGEDWPKRSMAQLIKDNPNIIVTRTFSKIFGMAGQRMGFIMGSKEFIQRIESDFMMGFPGNMPNSIGVAAAMAALEDRDFLNQSRARNGEMRQFVYNELNRIGWEYAASDANFVYFNTGDFAKFKSKMNANKILIAGGWPAMKDWGRVTIGNEKELETFFRVLKQ